MVSELQRLWGCIDLHLTIDGMQAVSRLGPMILRVLAWPHPQVVIGLMGGWFLMRGQVLIATNEASARPPVFPPCLPEVNQESFNEVNIEVTTR